MLVQCPYTCGQCGQDEVLNWLQSDDPGLYIMELEASTGTVVDQHYYKTYNDFEDLEAAERYLEEAI